MQIAQRRYGDPRLTEFQSRTCDRIEHPTCNRLDFTAVGLDVDYLRTAPLLDISDLDALAVQWMPTIMDFDFLPDMGRMNATCASGARTSCLRGRTAAASGLQEPVRNFVCEA